MVMTPAPFTQEETVLSGYAWNALLPPCHRDGSGIGNLADLVRGDYHQNKKSVCLDQLGI